jgi:hypothetical protein
MQHERMTFLTAWWFHICGGKLLFYLSFESPLCATMNTDTTHYGIENSVDLFLYGQLWKTVI